MSNHRVRVKHGVDEVEYERPAGSPGDPDAWPREALAVHAKLVAASRSSPPGTITFPILFDHRGFMAVDELQRMARGPIMSAPPEERGPHGPEIAKPAKQGSKYIRSIPSRGGPQTFPADVYDVLRGFGVSCPCIQHAVKKLLCPGQRGKGSRLDDLRGALEAIQRAVEYAEADAAPPVEPIDEAA